jgi:hypothetical protein
MLFQNSRLHAQGWRANGDMSIIVSKSDPANPSIDEILATEKYVTEYACKGNQPTGAIADLFQDMKVGQKTHRMLLLTTHLFLLFRSATVNKEI